MGRLPVGADDLAVRSDFAEMLRLHVDASVGAASRRWFIATTGMQALTIAAVIAAMRL
jgi:hypothetical protein